MCPKCKNIKLKKLSSNSKSLKTKMPACPECGHRLTTYLYPRSSFHYKIKRETGKFPCDHPDFVCHSCGSTYAEIK